MEDPKSFNYVLSHKKGLLLLSLRGDLTPGILPGLEACRAEILSKTGFTRAVFYLADVTQIHSDAIPLITQIFRDVRTRAANLQLVGLKPNMRDRFVKMGVVRESEVSADLKAALTARAG